MAYPPILCPNTKVPCSEGRRCAPPPPSVGSECLYGREFQHWRDQATFSKSFWMGLAACWMELVSNHSASRKRGHNNVTHVDELLKILVQVG